jgi:hypothetical protein
VIRQQLITTPVTARLSGPNKVGHGIAIFPGISTTHRAKNVRKNESTAIRELKFTSVMAVKRFQWLVRVFYEMGMLSEVEEAKHESLGPRKQVPPNVLKWEKVDNSGRWCPCGDTVRNLTIVVVGVGV